MVLDELLDELEKVDLQYALLDSFIRVMQERIRDLGEDSVDYEENYPDSALTTVKEKIAIDTEKMIQVAKVFLHAFTKRVE